MHKDEFPDLSRCTLCGSCKASCPTYEDSLTEGMSARGRLKLVKGLMTNELEPSQLLSERLYSCILCGACSNICPLGIDIPALIHKGRYLLKKGDKRRRFLRYLLKLFTTWPDLSFKVLSMGQDFIMPFLSKRKIIPFSPEVPDQPFHTIEQVHKVPKKKGRVAIFTGCSVNYFFPHLGESLINVLQSLGYEVVLPKDEVCCGAPLRALGMEEEAAELARKNHRVFSRLKVDAILSLCPTCTLTLKHEYVSLIGKGLEKATDISVFLQDKLERVEAIDRTVTYHDPCHLQYSLGVKKEPRDIITRAGLSLIEPASQGCCGFGGTFCISFKGMSENLLFKQSATIMATKAATVVTSCPGCMLQLGRTITDRPVIHLIELIEEAYCLRMLYQEPVLAKKG
ncbi:MAG: (Fe-S)-binding protein, partial [Nitrospirae bacterium]|nr:(Fe-S)-binding protein [Nitrospirota bacterium]